MGKDIRLGLRAAFDVLGTVPCEQLIPQPENDFRLSGRVAYQYRLSLLPRHSQHE